MSKRKNLRSKRYSSRSANSIRTNRSSYHMELCTIERGLGPNTLNIIVDNEIQYVLQSKRKLLSKNTQFYDVSNKKLLYRAKSRGLLGYVSIKSPMYGLDLKFPRPQFSRGIYRFKVDGIDFFWDFEYAAHLRCFTTHDMKLVAQYFWKSSRLTSPFHASPESSAEFDFENLAQLIILRSVSESSVIKSIITYTGLLLLKNSIW